MAAAYIITHWLLEFGLSLHLGVRGVQAANSSQMTRIPVIDDWIFFPQKRHLKCKKKKKTSPPTKLSQTFQLYNPAERTRHFLSFPLNAAPVPHVPLPDFIASWVPSALLPQASFTQGRYRDVIKKTNHLGSSPGNDHPPTPSFFWLQLLCKQGT